MSFRIRLLLVLIISPLIALLVFMFLLTKEFEQDKIAYIFELQDETLKRVEAQIYEAFLSDKDWTPTYVFRSGTWMYASQDQQLIKATTELVKSANTFCQEKHLYTHLTALDKSRLIGRCKRSVNSEFVISAIKWTKLNDIFRVTSFQDFYLIHRSGTILYSSSAQLVGKNAFSLFPGSETLINQGKRTGRFKTKYNNEDLIGTENVLKDTPLVLLSMTPKDAARRAAYPFIFKGFITLIVIILVIFVIGHFLSHSLTKKIKVLLEAFKSYGAGQEDLRLPIQKESKDEFQRLNIGFNTMADQIKNLLGEKQAAAANEHEMKLAGDVQKMFFPKENNLFGTIEVQGFVWPASQCGGDWWHTFETNDKLIVIQGDVTGHGFTSALMTSAGRAVVASIESSYVSLEELATKINRTLFSISSGTFQMTFCGIEISKLDNSIHILNCSHEPPIIQYNDKSTFLTKSHGPRLGEKLNSEYKGETLTEEKVKMITMYSDGLREIVNEKGKILGERRLLKSIEKALPLPAPKRLISLQKEYSAFRGSADLIDDVSLVTVKFRA